MDTVQDEYIAGYLDGIQPVRIEVTKSDNTRRGYRIRTSLIFDTHTDQMRGFIDELLRDRFIRYHVSPRNDHHKRLKSNSRSAVIKLLGEFEDELVRTYPIYDYISNRLAVDQEQNKTNNKQAFANHIATIEEVFPVRKRGENVQYSTEFFEDEWDVKAEALDVTTEPETRDLSDSYVAGLLDGCGRVTVGISKAEDRKIGYSFSPRVEFTLTDATDSLEESLLSYLEENGITPNISRQNATITVSIQRLDDIETLLENIGPELIRHFYTANSFYTEIIPRMRDGEHTEEQGFCEIVALAEDAIRHSGRFRADNGSVKYTAEFFENEFGIDSRPAVNAEAAGD